MKTISITLDKKKSSTKNITERVKAFEDACEVLDINAEELFKAELAPALNDDADAIVAFIKLTIIARALNEGWKPDWTDHNQYKYYGWFEQKKAGSGLSYGGYGCARSGTYVGSRLCFKSSELAEYAGKQFIDLYNDFLTLK